MDSTSSKDSSAEMIPIIKITDSSNSDTESNNSSPRDGTSPSGSTEKLSNETKKRHLEPKNVDDQDEIASNSIFDNMETPDHEEDFEDNNNNEQLNEMLLDIGMDEAFAEEEAEEKSILKNCVLQEELLRQILKKILEAKELFLSQEENEEESFGNEDNSEDKGAKFLLLQFFSRK